MVRFLNSHSECKQSACEMSDFITKFIQFHFKLNLQTVFSSNTYSIAVCRRSGANPKLTLLLEMSKADYVHDRQLLQGFSKGLEIQF